MAPLSELVRRLVDGRNFAHLATTMPDGSPHSAPVWIAREGDRLLISTDEDSVKGKNIARDPRVAISIVDLEDPYTHAELRGRVVEHRPDTGFRFLDAVSMKYAGIPWPYKEAGEGEVLVIEIDKQHAKRESFKHKKQ